MNSVENKDFEGNEPNKLSNIVNKENDFQEKINEFVNSAFEKAGEELMLQDIESEKPICSILKDSFIIQEDKEFSNSNISNVQKAEFCLIPEQFEIINQELKNDQTKKNLTKRTLTKIVFYRQNLIKFFKKPQIKKLTIFFFIGAYIIYFILSMYLSNPFFFINKINSTTKVSDEYIFYNNKGLGFLITNFVVVLLLIWEKYGEIIPRLLHTSEKIKTYYFKMMVKIILTLSLGIFFLTNINSVYNVISLIGFFVFISLCVIMSKDPTNVNMNIIVNGVIFQLSLGLIVIRNELGFKCLKFISEKVVEFLDSSDSGSKLVFGENFRDHYFAFKACVVIIFFGSIVNFFYYIGFLQFVILKLSWIINKILGTSPTESVNATANIFVGQSEAPLVIKPFLNAMTDSEVFAVMVGGFSTASGSVLAGYLGFGVSVNNVIVASLLGAPGSLIIAKTLYPETEVISANFDMIKNMPKDEIYNFFDALSKGAVSVIKAVSAIVANLLAFTSFFAFINKLVSWFFSMINLENFGITELFQYMFFPVVFLMGVNIEDCKAVSKLIGIKIFVTEFLAYSHMGKMVNVRNELIKNGLLDSYLNGTYNLSPGSDILIHDRSVTIATYSLCGFANMASVGLQIACLSSLAPNRAKLFPKIGFYAMIAGNICNFINACIAGMCKSQKDLDDLQQCQGIKKMLINDYPKSVSLCFILVGLVLGLTAIGLQIYSIIKKTPLYYIGTGIWVGALMVINELLLLNLTIRKTIGMFYISSFFRHFCFIITTALMFFSINSIRKIFQDNSSKEYVWADFILLAIGLTTKFTYLAIHRVFIKKLELQFREILVTFQSY